MTEEKLPEGILENLLPDEEVLYTVKKFALEAKPKWLVVTNIY